MWSAEAGNGLEARVGAGKPRGGGRKAAIASPQATGESDSKCHPQYFLSPVPSEPRYRTQSQARGEGRRRRVAIPAPRARRCPRRARRRSRGPGGRRGAGGSAETGVWLPGARRRRPFLLLARPLPSGSREEGLAPVSPASRSRREARTDRGRERERRQRGSRGRKRGGGRELGSRGWPGTRGRLELHMPAGRATTRGCRRGEGQGEATTSCRPRRRARLLATPGAGTRVRGLEWGREPIGAGRGWDRERAPEAVGTPILLGPGLGPGLSARAWRQGKRPLAADG